MSMDLHTDRVDRTIGDSDNFGKIWGWTALVIFFGVITLSAASGGPADSGPAGWFAVTLMAGFAAAFPGVMVAALLHAFSD